YSVLPKTHVIYQPTTTIVKQQPETIVIEQQPVCAFTHRQAWELLAQGPDQLPLAVEAFTCLAEEHPYDGLTIVGLWLATAYSGDYETAADLMRFAARVDIESLLHVPADRRIDEIIFDLVGGYSQL